MENDLLAVLRAEETSLLAELRATTAFRRLAAIGDLLRLYRAEPAAAPDLALSAEGESGDGAVAAQAAQRNAMIAGLLQSDRMAGHA
jgi:hypothetical protein